MMALAGASVAILLILSATLTAAHDAAFRIGASHIRTLQGEGFDGADALARVRAARHAVRASVRVVTQAFDLSALAIITLTGVSTWGAAGPR